MKRVTLPLAALLLSAGMATPAFAQEAETPEAICASASAAEPDSREFVEAEQVLEPGVDYRAVLCTSAGPIYVDLYENEAPQTVNNFVFLAQQDFYNNTTFHRVIQDFMAQGGDPTGTGSGGPGYQFPDEFVGYLNFENPGLLAMANANRPEQGIVGTNGSQFFITTVPTPHLNFRHTIFGEVLSGMDNVTAIDLRDPASATEPGTALDTVVIVTDPSTVAVEVPPSEPATQDEIVANFDLLGDALGGMSVENTVASLATEEVASGVPEAFQPRFAELLETHGHQFRVSDTVTGCDPNQLPFMKFSYTLDAFASAEDAKAVLNDPLVGELAEAQGFTVAGDAAAPNPLYTQSVTQCDQPATRAMTLWVRGRYLITGEIILPEAMGERAALWLTDVNGIGLFESYQGGPLRGEIRAE